MTTEKKAFEKLQQLYDNLDEELTRLKFKCDSCGECCFFEKQEHILYATKLEIDFFTYMITKKKIASVDNIIERCPFQRKATCLAHKMRPLGCRSYFCNPIDDIVLEDLSCKYHERLQKIHKEFNIDWEYKPFVKEIR